MKMFRNFLVISFLCSVCGSAVVNQIRLGEERDQVKLWQSLKCLVKVHREEVLKNEGKRRKPLNLQPVMEQCAPENVTNPDLDSGIIFQEPLRSDEINVRLLCRESESIAVIVEKTTNKFPDAIFLVKVDPESVYYLSTVNRTIISQLLPETRYSIKSYLLFSEKSPITILETPEIEVQTLSKDHTPGSITNATQGEIRLNKFKELDVDVLWDPVKESTCLYNIVCHSPKHRKGILHYRLNLREGNAVPQRLSQTIHNLSFNTPYKVRIYSFNERDPSLEGPTNFFDFHTPLAEDFNISLVDHPFHTDQFNYTYLPTIIEDNNWMVISVTVGFICFVILGIIWIFRKRILIEMDRRGRRLFDNQMDEGIEMEVLNTSITIYLDNESELAVNNLKIDRVLGQGAFGLVRKAVIQVGDSDRVVAVKMLRKRATNEDLREFKHEIDVMKSVGKHPNIVGLVGHTKSTSDEQQLMILIEYCNKGNLLNFLREEWTRIANALGDSQRPVGVAGDAVENPCYGVLGSLTNRDLMSIACQIAQGMEHLAVKKVVHRDLAARNILVCDGNLVKISDFGLSRDVYQYNMYKKKGSGKLPIKWLALESLTHQVYTSQSDVWSFGILLYEILTLGSDPYPSVPTKDILKCLNSGYRMERPSNCPEDIYAHMLDCWKTNPAERPSFRHLNETFEQIFREMTDERAMIVLDPTGQSQRDYQSYLKPIST